MKSFRIFALLFLVPLLVSAADELYVRPLQTHSGVGRYDIQLSVRSSQSGEFVHYQNFAAYPWRNGVPETPLEGKGMKIVAEYANDLHQFVWYYDGAFRHSTGKAVSAPLRWAYLREREEIWDGNAWRLPDGSTAPLQVDLVTLRADDLQGAIDFLMDHFTVPAIQDAMDESDSYYPKSGAPDGN